MGGYSATIEHNCVRHLARFLLGGIERIVRLTSGHRDSESAVTLIEVRPGRIRSDFNLFGGPENLALNRARVGFFREERHEPHLDRHGMRSRSG